MTDTRRIGDLRPMTHDFHLALTITPSTHDPTRFLPRHGQPYCIGEWLSQHVVRALAYLPIYTAVVVTIIVLIQVFGLPFVKGR